MTLLNGCPLVCIGAAAGNASIRLPGDPAYPGTLHRGSGVWNPRRAARADGASRPRPVRQLRRPARAGARTAG